MTHTFTYEHRYLECGIYWLVNIIILGYRGLQGRMTLRAGEKITFLLQIQLIKEIK